MPQYTKKEENKPNITKFPYCTKTQNRQITKCLNAPIAKFNKIPEFT